MRSMGGTLGGLCSDSSRDMNCAIILGRSRSLPSRFGIALFLENRLAPKCPGTNGLPGRIGIRRN
jgi:hypothetical protein